MTTPSQLQQLREIHRKVQRFLGPGYDTEAVASDIWLSCWSGNQQPTWTFIRSRCYDVLRSSRVRLKHEGSFRPIEQQKPEAELIEQLVTEAHFSLLEARILYKRFWLDQPVVDIADETGLSIGQVHQLLVEMLRTLKMLAFRRNGYDHR